MDCDASLAQSARAGNTADFAQLIERHQPLLRRSCARVLRDAPLVDDVVQEAVLQALLGLDRLRQPDSFGAWLVGIGLTLCRRALRDGRARPVFEPLSDEPSPEHAIEEA